MNQDKMHLVNKIFNNETIRTVWDKEQEKYFISVVDIVGVISESDNPRNYWKVLKHRLKQEGNESVTNCNQLKLKASDGKYYNTDVVDIEGMFRIIESIPSKNAEPISAVNSSNARPCSVSSTFLLHLVLSIVECINSWASV